MQNKKGHHINIAEFDIKSDFEFYKENFAANLLQIFVNNPKKYLDPIITPAIGEILSASGADIYVHSCYLNSLGNKKIEKIVNKNIIEELRSSAKISAKGLVIHLPTRSPAEIAASLMNIQKCGEDLLSQVPIFLEMESYSPARFDYTYETPAKISGLFEELGKCGIKNCGFCIDTAHLWAANVNISSFKDAETYLNEYSSALGGVSTIIHLNDSGTELGSGHDIHAPLTYGLIWMDYGKLGHRSLTDSGLCAVLEKAAEGGIPLILERRKDYKFEEYPKIDNITSDYIVIEEIEGRKI